MTKELNSIYCYLEESFWTSRKCHHCHQLFTPSDYQTQNYQLIFLEVLEVKQLNLEIVVQLTHKSCCSGCISYLQDLKLLSTLISKIKND